MGSRDHSTACEVCRLQRGGLNDYKCLCAPALGEADSEIQTNTDDWTVLHDGDIERLKAERERLAQGDGTARLQITERHGDVLIIAATVSNETWTVSSTRISDNEPLACSSLHGSRAAFEAGRVFQQHVSAALQSQDPCKEAPWPSTRHGQIPG